MPVLILLLLHNSEYCSYSWIILVPGATSTTPTEFAEVIDGVGSSPYASTLLLSWQPLGWMPLDAVELNVIAHVKFERDEKQYTAREWFGKNGIQILGADSRISNITVVDHADSLSMNSVVEVLDLELEPRQGASIMARRSYLCRARRWR